jgi:hypothetical protein
MRPNSPRPITPTVSPSCTSACRTPCMAIAPTVPNAASSSGSNATPPGDRRAFASAGTGTQRFFGTKLTSACVA